MSDWWSRRLGTPTPKESPQTSYPSSVPTPSKKTHPPSQTSEERCPGCGSDNYVEFKWSNSTGYRCYDCGYPLEQSTSGLRGTQPDGKPATPARQVSTEGYQPQNIQGRI